MNMMLPKRPAGRALAGLLLIFALSQAGCGPTYPKEIVDEAIMQLCREEYSLDVKVEIVGRTIGVYIPIEGLFSTTLNPSEEAQDKINDVLLSVTRVALSTDAPLDFYIVITQDALLPEIEVVLIRYIKDVKLFYYGQISRGDFFKRMIVDIKLTPQAQKEKVLRKVFERLNIMEADELISEYLSTSEVTTIGDIGYWNNTFFIKDIDMGEFLGLQIAERVKLEFVTSASLEEDFRLNLIEGKFLEEGGKRFFRFTFDVEGGESDEIFGTILDEAAGVLHGYKFEDFWNIEIIDARNNEVLFAAPDELEEFRKKKMKLEEFRRWAG